MSHIATAHQIYSNPHLQAELTGYLRLAREAAGSKTKFYGLTDINEMMAESYSNENFGNFLRGVETPQNLSLWARVKNLFLRAIGRGQDVAPATRSLFDQIMDHHEQMFTGERHVTTPGEGARLRAMERSDDPRPPMSATQSTASPSP